MLDGSGVGTFEQIAELTSQVRVWTIHRRVESIWRGTS